MSRLALYGIAAAILLAIGTGLLLNYGHQRFKDGERAAEARMQKLVDAEKAKVAKLEAASRKSTETHAHEIESQRQDRAGEGDAARGVIEPVRLCVSPRSDRAVPGAPGPAAAAHRTGAAEELPVRAGPGAGPAEALQPGRDIGDDLIALAESCQRDHDDRQAWVRWYQEQAALRAAF